MPRKSGGRKNHSAEKCSTGRLVRVWKSVRNRSDWGGEIDESNLGGFGRKTEWSPFLWVRILFLGRGARDRDPGPGRARWHPPGSAPGPLPQGTSRCPLPPGPFFTIPNLGRGGYRLLLGGGVNKWQERKAPPELLGTKCKF